MFFYQSFFCLQIHLWTISSQLKPTIQQSRRILRPPSPPTNQPSSCPVCVSLCGVTCPPVRSVNYLSPRYNVPVANSKRIAYRRLRGAFLGYNSLDPPLELWPAANWGNQFLLSIILNSLLPNNNHSILWNLFNNHICFNYYP